MAELPVYPGMRVEVLTPSNELLFEAKISRVPRADFAELEKLGDEPFTFEGESMEVRLRGFNARQNRGYWLEGTMLRFGQSRDTYWLLEKLRTVGQDSGRTFSRAYYDTAEGVVSPVPSAGEEIPAAGAKCVVTNLSYGGAAVRTAAKFKQGDSVLLEIRLRKGREQGPLLCKVRRVNERDDGEYDYGCQFVTDTEEQDSRVIRTLMEVQMMGMPNEVELPPPIFQV